MTKNIFNYTKYMLINKITYIYISDNDKKGSRGWVSKKAYKDEYGPGGVKKEKM